MATDLDTGKEQGETAHGRPNLKITGLHIRGLKSIKALDLPADGLGWEGPIPDLVMVGGINGSGKTTLLEFLTTAFSLFGPYLVSSTFGSIPNELQVTEALIDLMLTIPNMKGITDFPVRLIIGTNRFFEENSTNTWLGIEQSTIQHKTHGTWKSGGQTVTLWNLRFVSEMNPFQIETLQVPGVVFYPSEGRTLISPATDHKSAFRLLEDTKFIERWKAPEKWESSLEARLYGIRWEDLNAKEEGRPEDATHFQSYQLAFDRFFEGRKRLRWTPKGELVVETKSGDIHDLADLSSGEKQVILFMGELLHRWRPGSLILIDEPELHLHEHYQTRLWESLVDFQKERGGQVIVATQSAHLFEIARSAMKVLLSRQSL